MRLSPCLLPLVAALTLVVALPVFALDSSAPAPTDAALARPDLADYRGWLKYLRLETTTAASRHGADSAAASTAAARLADWTARITADPYTLAKLTGVQEWAYESPVDGSGQPFKLALPSDYDPAKPAALSVYLHGYSGNHLEHSTGLASQSGVFQLAVLGRSRGGGYRALSEADVLHVIDYVQAHWAIDPNRIHLNGGSMGGGGTYRLGARYPHRWASGRPTCGYASYVPLGNLLTLPLYATHSDDDYVVSALHDRGPLALLRSRGGQVIYDETTGLGHAAWDYTAGNARGATWVAAQIRPDSTTVRHLDYTALDGGAVRSWWAEIVEWGAAPDPARFVLTVGNANTLYAQLTNLTRLRLRLTESPLDRAAPLSVSVNGGVPLALPAPLPDSVLLTRGADGWEFESGLAAPPFRLHTPGSAPLLYTGEPLLIVYGTQGAETERTALRAAAEAASKSPHPGWLDDSGEAGTDGVPHSQNLYGRLNLKADTAVTAEDLARCHLVLIGTAAQNTLVARLAAQLPVQCSAEAITCSDGETFPAPGHALGLVHYNPLAPDRLLFWVAAADASAYGASLSIPAIMAGGTRIAGNPFGADLLVMSTTAPTLLAARTFDSRWAWSDDRAHSALLGEPLRTHGAYAAALAAALAQAANSDFGLATREAAADLPATTPGVTRLSDVRAFHYAQSIGVADFTGAQLATLQSLPPAPGGGALVLARRSGAATAPLDPARRYSVAFPVDVLWALIGATHLTPPYRVTELEAAAIVERSLLAP